MTPHRPGPQWLVTIRWIIALRPVAYLLWSLFGASVATVAWRVLLVSELKAESVTRLVADSVLTDKVDSLSQQVDTIRVNQKVNIRAVCLDHTLGEQALIGVTCPKYLYKGAK